MSSCLTTSFLFRPRAGGTLLGSTSNPDERYSAEGRYLRGVCARRSYAPARDTDMKAVHIMEAAVNASRATAWRNWAGNQQDTAALARPGSPDELAALITEAKARGGRLKAAGAGHSFTDIAATDGQRLDLSALPGPVHVDTDTQKVTVPAGMTLATLNALLTQHGLAVPNLGD